MKQINDLPVDVWILIFRNLSIDDLFNCRLVNKKFKNFSDYADHINKLVIGELFLHDDNSYRWFYNNKLIEDEEMMSLKHFKSIKSLSILNLDKNLKYLKIYDHQFELKELSNFINLECLELDYEYCINRKEQEITNFPNLKILTFQLDGYHNFNAKLNTSKLERIQFYDFNRIKFNYNNLESIKHLITINYNIKLDVFKNLEIMELKDAYQPVNENLLIVFPYLKQFKFDLNFIKAKYSNERIKNCLIKILNNRIKLKKQIDIYLEGIKIDGIDKFNKFTNTYSNFNWKFRLDNYESLDLDSFFVDHVFYEPLDGRIDNMKNDLPLTFFDKYQNITECFVDRVKDFDNLIWFLNNIKYLRRLSISYDVSFGQNFYYNLPSTIRVLYIRKSEDMNYDFILKLFKLIKFNTWKNKDLFNLAFQSFLELKFLKNFGFYIINRYILIKKKDQNFYLNDRKEKFDYNQLIEECNKIRSK